ncbi:hypothetical protein ACLBXO_23255 [Methylobacterium sp. C33D]
MSAASTGPQPTLPPALAPWTALFSDMAEPDLRILAALVEALRPLVERAEGAGGQPEGEIDGLGGLGPRGGIERLVASEWLWRDLDPDAFLQRAAERDLLTLEPVYRQAADAGAVLAVVDAGPDLLGAPRLVAFAALLCLSGLARRRGARLLWASTATRDRRWHEAMKRSDAATLLRESAATSLDAVELDQVLAEPVAARAAARPGASLWLIGGRDLPEPARPCRRITVVERPSLGPEGITVAAEVTVLDAAGRGAAARLDLPPEREAVALLRDPFRPRPAPGRPQPRRSEPDRGAAPSDWVPRGLAFTPDGEHLLVARPDGILIVPVSGATATLRLPVAPYERLVGLAVGRSRIRAACLNVYADDARLTLRSWAFDRTEAGATLDRRIPRDHPLAGRRLPTAALPPLGALKRRNRFWLLAADGTALLVSDTQLIDYASLGGEIPLAVTPAGLLMRDRADGVTARRRSDGQVLARFPRRAGSRRPRGGLYLCAVRGRPVLALEQDGGHWDLVCAADGTVARLRPQGRIVGVVPRHDAGRGQVIEGLLALHLDRDDAGSARLTLRTPDGAAVGNPVTLPDATLDAVRVGVDADAVPRIAAARCDAAGFVDALVFGQLDCGWSHLTDLRAFAETVPCLGA